MQPSTAQLAVIAPVLIIALNSICHLIQDKRKRKGSPLPPGPTQIPLLGNILGINIQEPWKTYTDWHAKYGDVLYLRMLDQDVIVLGSHLTAVDLLEKRSQLYSDRPVVALLGPLGGDVTFGFSPYGDHWRLCRRIFHQSFRPDAAINFLPMQLRRARQLVMNIVNNPDKYQHHYSTYAVAVALSAAYDYEPSLQHDPIVAVIEECMAISAVLATPEKSVLIKLFPFLLHIPDWLPGSSFKRNVKHTYDLSRKMIEMPYQYAEEKMRNSCECPTFSMVSDHLSLLKGQDESRHAEYIHALKIAGSSSIVGSEETTSSSLMVFTLAMVLHPHVWKRAQAEIDAIVGTDRLPDFGDRSALPYVDAIVRETFRWHPVLPLGVWHATTGSDIYNGYYIPNGATVVANVWAMSRDEDRYPNADAFVPERFLDQNGMLNDNDPSELIFGFGRRRCPGRYTADTSVWSAIATMLAMLDFHLAKDAHGREIDFEPKWNNGITHRPDVFPCQISLRAHVNKAYLEHRLTTEHQ